MLIHHQGVVPNNIATYILLESIFMANMSVHDLLILPRDMNSVNLAVIFKPTIIFRIQAYVCR